MRQNRVLAIRGVRQQLLVAVSKRLLLIAILYAFLPHRPPMPDQRQLQEHPSQLKCG